ncbi:MAG: efflux RND transporter periplasmic adaptor subunit [Hyphomicrobium sp.]
MNRYVSIFHLCLFLITVSIFSPLFIQARADKQSALQLPNVSVSQPISKKIALWDEFSGRFEAIHTVEVRPRVSGFIEQLHFKDGQMVKEGDLLFTIDPRPFELAVETAKADLARTTAQVQLANEEVERARPLLQSGAVTGRDFDQRNAALSVARAGQQSAEASLRNAMLNLEWTKVVAPINGRISDRKVDAGNLVNGGVGSTTILAIIVTTDPLHFIFDISESDFLRYQRLSTTGGGMSSENQKSPVKIRLADEKDYSHEGTLNFIDNTLNPRSGTLRVRAIIANASGLLQPGLFGRVALYGGEIDAFLVPDTSIVADQERKIVFVVTEDNIIKSAQVVLGPMEKKLRVILSGLTLNDKVVLDGIANPLIRPGTRVNVEKTKIEEMVN